MVKQSDHASNEDAAELLKVRLRKDLTAAMRARAARDVAVLRALIGALDNAQAVAVGEGHVRYMVREFGDPKGEFPRQRLGAGDVGKLLDEEIADRMRAADQCEALGRADRADELRAEADIVSRYTSR